MWRQWMTADVAMDGSNNRGGLLMQCVLMVENVLVQHALMVQSALWCDKMTADVATVGKTADVATTGLLILRQGRNLQCNIF